MSGKGGPNARLHGKVYDYQLYVGVFMIEVYGVNAGNLLICGESAFAEETESMRPHDGRQMIENMRDKLSNSKLSNSKVIRLIIQK